MQQNVPQTARRRTAPVPQRLHRQPRLRRSCATVSGAGPMAAGQALPGRPLVVEASGSGRKSGTRRPGPSCTADDRGTTCSAARSSRAHRQAWLGTVQLTRPVPLWVATGFVLGVAILVGAFLWTGEYTRKARVTGFLAPDRGVIRLVAPQAATVVEAHAREGQAVRQGDTLFVLAVGQSRPSGDTQAAVAIAA